MCYFLKKTFSVASVILLTMSSCSPPQPIFSLEEVPLIPLPSNVKTSDEVLPMDAIQSILVKDSDNSILSMAESLRAFWKENTQRELTLSEESPEVHNTISLEIDENLSSNDEAYALEIGSNVILIKGKTKEGIFRGIKTLEQMITLSQLQGKAKFSSLPGGVIIDEPTYGYRGAMLDVARHFFSVSDVKRYIDLLSIYKINFLHFHLSDDQGWRIEIKSWPRLTEIGGQTQVGGGEGGFYTQDDFKEIVQYASERFITIVPEIDLPGHTNAALASYAELNCNGKATELYTGIKVGFSKL